MLPFYDVNAKLRYIKFCLLVFTFMLILTGIGLVVIGTTINAIYSEYSYFLRIASLSPATGVVFVGFLIFGAACVGLFGTIKQKPFVIASYGVLLGILCIFQLGLEFAGHMTTSVVTHNIRIIMNETMYNYPYDVASAEIMDKVQSSLGCCGIYSGKDWYSVYDNPEIPKSCCAANEEGVACQYFYNRGCYSVLAGIAADTNDILATSSNILCVMEVLGLAFAFYLARCLSRQIRMRKERKLLVTEQLLYSDAGSNRTSVPAI